MSKHARKSCPQCQRLQRLVEAQAADIRALRSEVLQVREQLAAALKNSATSSKPPSSDIVKPQRPADADAGEPRKDAKGVRFIYIFNTVNKAGAAKRVQRSRPGRLLAGPAMILNEPDPWCVFCYGCRTDSRAGRVSEPPG